MPLENIQFALIWPLLPARHQTGLDGVFHNIEPLLTITLTAAKLPVEKIFLPNGLVASARPASRCLSTPEFHPTFERRHRNMRGGTEKVDVIRHNHIAPHQPMIRFAPRFDEQMMDFGVRQQRTTAFHVATDVLYYALIGKFQRRQMRQLLPTGFRQWLIHFLRRDELRESPA
jgi:hypothetical protein